MVLTPNSPNKIDKSSTRRISTFSIQSRPRSLSSIASYPNSAHAPLRHFRSFGTVGERLRPDSDEYSKVEKRRDHPFAFACWLLHLGLVYCIGCLLLYCVYIVIVSKNYPSSFGPQILNRKMPHISQFTSETTLLSTPLIHPTDIPLLITTRINIASNEEL